MAYIHRSERQYATTCQGVTQLPKVYVTVRLLTVDPFVNRQLDYKTVGPIKNQSGVHRVRKQVNEPACAVRKRSISWYGQKVGLHVRCSAGHRWLSTEGSTVTDQSPHMYNL